MSPAAEAATTAALRPETVKEIPARSIFHHPAKTQKTSKASPVSISKSQNVYIVKRERKQGQKGAAPGSFSFSTSYFYQSQLLSPETTGTSETPESKPTSRSALNLRSVSTRRECRGPEDRSYESSSVVSSTCETTFCKFLRSPFFHACTSALPLSVSFMWYTDFARSRGGTTIIGKPSEVGSPAHDTSLASASPETIRSEKRTNTIPG